MADAPALRKQLAEAFSKAATAKGVRLGRLRLALADAALDVFDDDARQKLADELMEATRIRSMEIRNGGFDMDIDAAREITALYVGAARTMLGDAPNYSETPVELTVKVAEAPESYIYVLTVQRAEKPTPHQLRKQAEAERDQVREVLQRVERVREAMRHIAENGVDHIQRVAWTNAESLLTEALEGGSCDG
jgi:hypothetical protein